MVARPSFYRQLRGLKKAQLGIALKGRHAIAQGAALGIGMPPRA
jgi:hypothetical protein